MKCLHSFLQTHCLFLKQEGVLFMHEMMELSKAGNGEVNPMPAYVQLISSPYMGSIALKGGPAQFGLNLEQSEGVSTAHSRCGFRPSNGVST